MMKIQSVSDIITNSSSEVFLFKSDKPLKELKKLINEHADEHYICNMSKKDKSFIPDDENCNQCSGMGGDVVVSKFKESDVEYYELDEEKFEEYSKGNIDDIFMLDIDWHYKATIKWFEDTFDEIVQLD